MLESQLALFLKGSLSDKVKSEMNELLIDKNKFEALAKESLRRAQEERCEALQRLADVERSLLNTGPPSCVNLQPLSIITKSDLYENTCVCFHVMM